MKKKNKKQNVIITIKPDFLIQNYSYSNEWKEIYYIEDRIINIIQDIYFGKIIIRYEIYDLVVINLQFKIFSDTYECMISKRNNDYGFSIYNIDDPQKYNSKTVNKTIEKNKLYLYNIYKMVFSAIRL